VSSSPTDISALVDITMPQMGVSVVEGTIVAWRVAVGDRVTAEQTVCDISTDKIETEVPAPQAGIVAEILVGVEQTVEVGVVLARMAVGDGNAVAAPVSAPATNGHGRRYSPVVQRIAAEHGVDLASVSGTGRGGRVRKQDVLAALGGDVNGQVIDPPLHIESPYRPDPPAPATPAPAPAPAQMPDAGGEGLSRMRRQIGEHMKRSLEVAATCTTWAEADLTRVESVRKRVGVTALAYVARATVEALREHPALNAWLDGETYQRFGDVNLGIAVSLGDDGLIVPVIHRAQELSVEGLGSRIRDLAARARARQLTPDDVSGATFTITAPGQFGSIMATPVINQPQVAILDFEAVVKRPVVLTDADGNDSIGIRSMTILGMSWDHRALDGALAAQFLSAVRARLESPPD
jgi:pyruvate/2-oxoglutarate dehydrogenase complex dihydrolipoamide acyltransferase (E2) component